MQLRSCCSEGIHKLNPLIIREPQGINAIGDEEWVEIGGAIDSGATETVMSQRTHAGVIDITEGPAMKRGVTYEVADGTEISARGSFSALLKKEGKEVWPRKFVR